MTDYAFVTRWRIDAPIEAVFGLIHASSDWPSWWPAVTDVTDVLPSTGPSGIGNVRRYTFKGALPYALAFDLRVTRVEPPNLLAGEASGELEGTGVWTLSALADGGTLVRYDWNVRTTRSWMNLLAPIARPLFRANHDHVMRSGLDGMRQRLGATGAELTGAELTDENPGLEPQPANTNASTAMARNNKDR